MAMTGDAKRRYQRLYMRQVRARFRADREVEPLEKDVLRLALAGYINQEIRELLDISEEALKKELDRVAEYLCPTPASELSVNPRRCDPLRDVA
jgi:DNA-binding CsgD family transcriptional regulator